MSSSIFVIITIGCSVKSISLNTYIKEVKPKYAIRLSAKNFGFENNIKSVPLYAVFALNKEEKYIVAMNLWDLA